jgi:hypothetical protein
MVLNKDKRQWDRVAWANRLGKGKLQKPNTSDQTFKQQERNHLTFFEHVFVQLFPHHQDSYVLHFLALLRS